jgi:hypothetical protein
MKHTERERELKETKFDSEEQKRNIEKEKTQKQINTSPDAGTVRGRRKKETHTQRNKRRHKERKTSMYEKGDQSGRIFTACAIVCYGQNIFKLTKRVPKSSSFFKEIYMLY